MVEDNGYLSRLSSHSVTSPAWALEQCHGRTRKPFSNGLTQLVNQRYRAFYNQINEAKTSMDRKPFQFASNTSENTNYAISRMVVTNNVVDLLLKNNKI